MSYKLPLLEEVLKYHNEEKLILSMPGNKCGRGFRRDRIGQEFRRRLGDLDITEVGNLDNLHHPNGVIEEAQTLLAKTYNAKKAYFLVNGSSSGNLASIFAAFNEGDEVLVERNCHKSVYNALILRKLKVVYIEANIDLENGILLPCNEKNIVDALKKSKKPKGIILTTPNYYGISSNLENILNMFKANGLKIVIDAAHGSHYGFSERLPKSMVDLAHYVVMSAHKTLPALTQGAYLLVNDNNSNIEFFISAFNTTSPSYLIMSSLDYSRYYLDNYAKEDYEKLIDLSEVYTNKINSLDKVKILSKEDITEGYYIDKSRYVMTLPVGFSGSKLFDYLLENSIQSEMSYSRGVVLILSPFNTREDFEKIYRAIVSLDMEVLRDDKKKIEYKKVNNIKVLDPFEVHNKKYEEVELNEAVGRISKDFVVPYPPGIPMLLPGEKITEDIIKNIRWYQGRFISILGIYYNRIKVVIE